MKILIIGEGRHGKDTVAEMLRDYHGWSFRSSSHWCAEHVIYPVLQQRSSPLYMAGRDWKWFYENRHKEVFGCGRQFWFEQILDYNKKHGGAAVARGILAENDIYVGMRSRYEFDASMEEELFDKIIWVDRSEHLPPEGDSMELTQNDADIIISNNSTLRDLWFEVDAVNAILRREERLHGN